MNECRTGKRKIPLTIGYILLILGSSLIPMNRQIPGLGFMINLQPKVQNLLHVPAFAVLAIMLLQVLQSYRLKPISRLVLVMAACIGFGLFNEAIQIFIPGRYAGLLDMGLNVLGGVLGVIVYFVVDKGKPGLLRRLICE